MSRPRSRTQSYVLGFGGVAIAMLALAAMAVWGNDLGAVIVFIIGMVMMSAS